MSSWSSEDEERLRDMQLRRKNSLLPVMEVMKLVLGNKAEQWQLEHAAGLLVLHADAVVSRLKPFCKGE